MRKILYIFLIALLPMAVSAQNDNVQRPPKKTVQQAPPKKTEQQVPPKRTQPAKPAKQITQQSTPSHTQPVDSAKVPQDTTTSYPQPTTPNQQTNLQTIPQVLTPPAEPEIVKPTTGYEKGYEWVDLGLSVKWATMNVGATSPSDYGGYYAWGETSTKSSYDWSNCFDCVNPKKWNKDSGWGIYRKGGQTKITPASGHDTARENWGGTWRMPTRAEIEELSEKCKWTWTSQDGHSGYKVTGPNGNSIFLPAAGDRDGTDTSSVDSSGCFWTSTNASEHSLPQASYGLGFGSSYRNTNIPSHRKFGMSVRPVTE